MDENALFQNVKSRPSVDYMLRTQQQNNVLLIQIADQKANILIGLTAIVLTLILCRLSSDSLSVPLLLFSGFSVLAALFALLALLPRTACVRSKNAAGDKTNLLYFSHFSRIDKQDYFSQMSEMLLEDQRIYGAIVGDIYGQGRVLERKYRYLRFSYLLLAIGIVAAVVVWGAQQLPLLQGIA